MAWGYAAAGLGQGALEGFMAGSEIAERRRRAKQEQQREALMMLYPAIKQDPKALEQLKPFLQEMLGPKFQMPEVKSPFEQQKAEVAQAMPWLKQLAPGMSDEDRLKLALGYAPSRAQPPVEAIPYDPANPPSGQFQGRPRFFPIRTPKDQTAVEAVPYDPENPPSGQYKKGTKFFPVKTPGQTKLPKGPDIEKQVDNLLKGNVDYMLASPEERLKMRANIKTIISGGGQETPTGPPGIQASESSEVDKYKMALEKHKDNPEMIKKIKDKAMKMWGSLPE